MASKRTKIPEKTAGLLMFNSDLKCCVCQEKGQQIHHLNEDGTDHRLDNLAFLCLNHHSDATLTGGLSRKLSKETIINYRSLHYEAIKNERKKLLGNLDHPIKELTEEKLLIASKNAIIIIELADLKSRYLKSEWSGKGEILDEIYKYLDHVNNRVILEVYDLMRMAAVQTRAKMPIDVVVSICGICQEFCPSFSDEEELTQSIKLAKTCIYISHNIIYDAFIHCNNLLIAMHGLSVIKYVYRLAKENDVKELLQHIIKSYEDLETTLDRPKRKDLENAKELLAIFKKDLEDWDLSFPILTPNLMKAIAFDEKK